MAVSSPRLDQLAERVRLRAVGWESYARAGLLSNSDVELVQRAAGSQGDSIRNGEDEETYAALYTRLLANLNRNEARSSVLALLADFIAADGKQDGRIKLILKQSPYEALLKLLDTSDDFIKLEATAVLCTLVGADQEVAADVVDRLLTHIARLFGGSGVDSSAASTSSGQSGSGSTADPDTQLVAAQSLAALFRRSDARQAAWKRDAAAKSDSKGKSNGDQPDKSPRAIAPCVIYAASFLTPQARRHPSHAIGAQQLVRPLDSARRAQRSAVRHRRAQLGCDRRQPRSSAAVPRRLLPLAAQLRRLVLRGREQVRRGGVRGRADIDRAYGGMIPALVELSRNAVKEKVVRVVLATFRNLVTRAPDANTAALLNAKCPAYLAQLQQSRRWGDDEVREDVDFLAQELKSAKQKLTCVRGVSNVTDCIGPTTSMSPSSSRAISPGRRRTRTPSSGETMPRSSTPRIASSSSAREWQSSALTGTER